MPLVGICSNGSAVATAAPEAAAAAELLGRFVVIWLTYPLYYYILSFLHL